jgi:hypothetical protein
MLKQSASVKQVSTGPVPVGPTTESWLLGFQLETTALEFRL